ncbi:hypothetical protein DESC_500042 [Desulfosarcina cetonica]|nr:hypothetical protein DESC_500042 [Desulfosarcina cetonica]
MDGLGDEVRSIQPQGPDGGLHFTEGRGDDHLGIGKTLFDHVQELQAIHAGHANIGDDDLGREGLTTGQAIQAIDRGLHPVAGIHEGQGGDFADIAFIVDDQHGPVVGGHGGLFAPRLCG